jgi:predicted deacylase
VAARSGARRRDFVCGGREVAPGTAATIEIPLPLLYTHNPVALPARVVHGRRDGPTLLVCAGVHGDELNGMEVIRRLVGLPPLERLRGTLLAVPVVNVYGFVRHSRYLPDRRDLNRSFPGSEKGSLTARLAHVFVTELVSRCSHGIDLHTGAVHRENLPQIRGTFDPDSDVERMARAFATPVMLDSRLRDGSLRQAAADLGAAMIVYEAGEALRFDEVAVRAGVRGVLGVMRELGMLPARGRSKPRKESVLARSSHWVRAPQSGVLRAVVPLGARVARGELLGFIADPLGGNEAAVSAPDPGVVIGKLNLPLVNEGEALYHIARFGTPDAAAEAVEAFHWDLDPETDTEPPDELPISA